MFVWHSVVILYDLGYIVTVLDLQWLTIDKNTIKALQCGLGTHFTLCCVEMWLIVSAANHPHSLYKQEGRRKSFHLCLMHGRARGQKDWLLVQETSVWAEKWFQGSWIPFADLIIWQTSSSADAANEPGLHHKYKNSIKGEVWNYF